MSSAAASKDNSAYSIPLLLTAVVWGWFPFLPGWRYAAPPKGDQFAFWGIWIGALIPPYRACVVLFDRSSGLRDMRWVEVFGLLLVMATLVGVTIALIYDHGRTLVTAVPLAQSFPLAITGQLGRVVGLLVACGALAAMLLAVGVIGRLIYVGIIGPSASVRPNIVMLFVGWATLPAVVLLIWVVKRRVEERIVAEYSEAWLAAEGRRHWRQHLPKLYRALDQSGLLEQSLLQAAQQTRALMDELVHAGLSPFAAWAEARQEFLILDPRHFNRSG